VSVVAKDEDQAREFITIMDPEFFAANPDTEIQITDENEASLRKIKETNDWVQGKLEKGRAWIARPKIWMARGRASEPAFSNRYYIAAVTRDDAIAVLNQLDPGYRLEDLYVNDTEPSDNNYEAYKTAQEDLIRQQNDERINRQAAQDETIDVSNLRGWRVSNSTTFMYVVAENGAEAAEIANKMDPERFPDVSDMTVQTAGTIGAETLIRGMYARQQAKLSEVPAQTAPKFEVNDRVEVASGYPSLIGMQGQVLQVSPNYDFVSVQIDGNNAPSSFPTSSLKKVENSTPARISDLRYYRVQRQDASGRADVAASSPEDAMNRVRQQNPTWRNSPLTAELL
jgi:hypothetical protein